MGGKPWILWHYWTEIPYLALVSLLATLSLWYDAKAFKARVYCLNIFCCCLFKSSLACVSPRMHPSEVWPRSHRHCGNTRGSSGPQEVNTVKQSAACFLSFSPSSLVVFFHSLSPIFVVQLENFSCSLSLAHRLAERGLALAGSEGGVSISPNWNEII